MSTAELGEQHPAWCSPEHCSVTDEGVRVHEQAPGCWEDHGAAVRVESQLLDPADDEDTYLQLSLENRWLTWVHYHGILPLEVARRLRDQLTEHLDAAQGASSTSREDASSPWPEDKRGNFLITGCGHPRRIRANGGVSECRLCDPRRPPVPDLHLPATELSSIDVMASRWTRCRGGADCATTRPAPPAPRSRTPPSSTWRPSTRPSSTPPDPRPAAG